MASLRRTTGLLAAAVLLSAGGTASAGTIEMRVPFPFVVSGQTLPAGEYRVEHEGTNVVWIRGQHGGTASVSVLTTPASTSRVVSEKPALTFTRQDTQYRLAAIWESGSQGREISVRK